MTPDLERALHALEEAAEFARTYRFDLTDDYLQLITQVEALPQNQSGSDKSHVWAGQRAFQEFFRKARPIPLTS